MLRTDNLLSTWSLSIEADDVEGPNTKIQIRYAWNWNTVTKSWVPPLLKETQLTLWGHKFCWSTRSTSSGRNLQRQLCVGQQSAWILQGLWAKLSALQQCDKNKKLSERSQLALKTLPTWLQASGNAVLCPGTPRGRTSTSAGPGVDFKATYAKHTLLERV